MKRTLSAVIAAIIAMALSSPAMAKYDEKFFKKAAEKVWSMDLPQFDPKADLTDSIFHDVSTACIARYELRSAEYETNVNVGKYLSTGRATTHVVVASRVYRVMLKLNDSKAVEDYTDFEFDGKESSRVGAYTMVETNTAFGARIYKPDGQIVNVDTGEAFAVTEGKKDKEVKRKLAIPGLAPGDVLEYFYYEEAYIDEYSIPEFQIFLLSSIPTKNFTFMCELSPVLTLEYASYNGAPLLSMVGGYSKDATLVGFTVEDLPAVDTDMPFFRPRRQLPYLSIMIQNNTSTMLYHPASARVGGVNLPTMDQVALDAGHAIADTQLPEVPLNRAVKLAKDWRKANPDATERQYIDAAWLALAYVLETESRSFSERAASVYFVDMLKKLKIKTPALHTLLSYRDQAPISHPISYNKVRYGTLVGDSVYTFWPNHTFVPGEISGMMAGEEMLMYGVDRSDKRFLNSTSLKRLPQSRSARNTVNMNIKASLDPDELNLLDVDCTMSFRGASKEVFGSLILKDNYYKAVEDYLGIPDNKRQKSKIDSEKFNELWTKASAAAIEAILDTKLHSAGTIDITSIGCTPDKPTTEFAFTAVAEDMVTSAGNNLMVNLGKLIGKQLQLTEKQRNREVGVIMDYPTNERFHITFSVPDGYTVNEESLNALNVSLNNGVGSFMSQAKISGNNVEVSIAQQFRSAAYSAEQWPEMVAIIDALNSFTGQSILLTPAK